MAIDLVPRIEELFLRFGHVPYEGERREAVTALEHALQCAQLAEWADAAPTLVAASLLHDVGHFLAAEAVARNDQLDDAHEDLAVPLLAQGFDAAVVDPVRLHVRAKRYLVRADLGYLAKLSPASLHSLRLQGGPMTDAEMAAFEAEPFSDDALQLRRWDEAAKQPGRQTPPLAYYLALLENVRERPFVDSKTGIGAFDVA